MKVRSQIVEFEVTEQNGIVEYQRDQFDILLSNNDCVLAYSKMRKVQSVKGFFRPEPVNVSFSSVIRVL